MKSAGPYNVVVIGAGTAGLVTAAGTAGLGGRVALIERHQMGGDCLNFGCVPSKALISSARLAQRIREAGKWGLRNQEPQFEFAEVMARMRERRAKIAPHDSQERFESLGVEVFRGEARFISPHEVQVQLLPSPQSSPQGRGGQRPRVSWESGSGGRREAPGEGLRLRARNFVIATGSRATIPQIEGIESVPYFTNETVFDELHQKPASMIVLGGGPIGCELGQAFSRLGVKITILQSGEQLLPPEDADVGEFMRQQLVAEGIEVRLNAQTKRVRQENGRIVATTDSGEIVADVLLIAAGRTPNLGSLNLEAAGVQHDEHGIEVNDYLQTSQPHIYAAGDICARLKFTHTADAAARVVVRNILMPLQLLRQKVNWNVVPWCTYTEPEVAHVGLGEKQASKVGVEYDLYRINVDELDRATVESETAGFAKILTRKGSDRILGVTIVSAHAGELIHEFVVAMNAGVGLGKLAGMIHAYPTFAELARKAGDKYNKTRLTPFAKKLFAWLYQRARK